MEYRKSTAANPKDATVLRHRRINMRMVQNVLLIWLDASIDEDNDDDYHNIITQLQGVVNNINTFTDGEQCIEFLETIDSKSNKACVIISDSLGEHIVSRVHKLPQVDSIFIFCSNEKHHEKWADDWPKIKGVFTEIIPICEALKEAVDQCEHNATPISFMATSGDDNMTQKKLDQLDCSFMYTQLFKNILLTITFEPRHIDEFIEHCRKQFADIERKLTYLQELRETYHKKTPVWWYTCESFLYRMLNTSLRLMDVDIMIKMGFFITDLHRQIRELHTAQFDACHFSTTFTLYRGQGMSTTDFVQMQKTMGGLIAFNSFLSTSKDSSLSLTYARSALWNPDLVGILFVMTIDPTQSTTVFALVSEVGAFVDQEEEVLFSMHSVFRIHNIQSMTENDRLFRVELTLTDDDDKDLRTLTDRMETELGESAGWDRLGYLLLKIQQSKKAETVYEILLKQTTNQIEEANYYHRLGHAKYNQGEYENALKLYEKAIAIREKLLPLCHLDLAASYNNIGSVYYNMGDYSKALSSHEKALATKQRSLPPNHPGLASCYNNIALVYFNMGDYSNALSSHEKALTIRQKSLPLNHPDLATSYINIGLVYKNMGDYSKALSSHEKALAIKQLSLPSNHHDLASSYNNIGLLYDNMGDYSKALSFYEKALVIKQESLPPNHINLARSYGNIGLVYSNMGDYSKSLLSYEKTLVILQQSLPSNHPDLAYSYMGIANVYGNMGDYSKALLSHEKALTIKQQSLPSNHPDLASSYNNIGKVYSNMGDYSTALSSYEKALAIRQQSLPPNHPDLASSYGHLGDVYSNIGKYTKAVSYCQLAVDIAQQTLPCNHAHLKWYSNNLERVRKLCNGDVSPQQK